MTRFRAHFNHEKSLLKFKPEYQLSKARAFTLIEMLLVVASIVLLLSMLLPALGQFRLKAKQATCQSNLRILSNAFASYSQQNHRQLIGTNTSSSWDWMRGGNTKNSITNGSLWPYVNSFDAYKCPDHVYPWYLNSYSLNGKLNGEQQNEGIGGTKDHLTRNMIPGKQLIFMEEDDHRGWNINSFMLPSTQGHFIDLVPANHNGGDNAGFLDGHVEYFKWEDSDTLIRPKHNPTPTFGFKDPGNVDWDKLDPVFRTWER